MTDIVVRASLVLAAALALAAILRGRSAALRHWILASGIVGAAVAPSLAAIVPAWHAPLAISRPTTPSPAVAAPESAAPSIAVVITRPAVAPRPRAAVVPTLAAALTWTWIAGATLGVFGLLAGVGRLRRIRRRATPLTDAVWREVFDAVARELGVSRRVTLLASESDALLVTWGVFAPTIIVPSAAARWPRERIRIVLAHELAHIARADWAAQMLAEIVRAAYWFNPLAWFACRRLRLDAEHACDDAVLALGIDGSAYASHLLDLARAMKTRHHAWAPAQAIVRPSTLERRITAMLNRRLDRSPLTRAGRLAAAAALLLVTTLAAGYSSAQGLPMLSGTVTDQVGGVMPDIPIVLMDLTTNAKHEGRTNALGRYEFAGLPAADYMLVVEKIPGFTTFRERVVLTGSSLERDVRLHVASIQESVTVTEGPTMPPPPATPSREQIQQWARDRATNGCDTPGGCIAPPIKTGNQKPVYPSTYNGPGGVVALRGTIDTTGHVTNLRVVGEANPDLAQAAIAAVSQWEFEPTRLDGVVIDTDINVSVNFKPAR